MTQATVSPLTFPASAEPSVDDPLTDVIRRGAKHLLAQAVEAEVEQWIADHAQAVILPIIRALKSRGFKGSSGVVPMG